MTMIIGSKGPTAKAAATTGADNLVRDTDASSFAVDVLEASMAVPVIVDFWAPWCGPCKQLGPILEKTVREQNGAVRMVKINIDENPAIARQFRIQSIPAVYAFKNGQPVDGFMGALPESQIKQFVMRLVGDGAKVSPVDELMAIATQAFETQDLQTAAEAYARILEAEPAHVAALGGLARCYIAAGDLEGAKNTLAAVPEDKRKDPAIAGIEATIMLAEKAGRVGDPSDLRAKVATNPADHQTRLDLALALVGAGDMETAINELLEIIRRDLAWNDGAARKELLNLFEALGPVDPLVASGRRRLSSILFR